METGIVHSSHGDITIDMNTGSVLSHGDNTEYRDVTKFDLDEYFRFYTGEVRTKVNEFDILDLGFWTNGEYEEPDNQWRKDLAEERAADKAGKLNVMR